MKTKPIVLGTDMVREILAGTRTAIPIIIKDANPMWLFESLSTDAEMLKVDSEGMEYPQPVRGLWATFDNAEGVDKENRLPQAHEFIRGLGKHYSQVA